MHRPHCLLPSDLAGLLPWSYHHRSPSLELPSLLEGGKITAQGHEVFVADLALERGHTRSRVLRLRVLDLCDQPIDAAPGLRTFMRQIGAVVAALAADAVAIHT